MLIRHAVHRHRKQLARTFSFSMPCWRRSTNENCNHKVRHISSGKITNMHGGIGFAPCHAVDARIPNSERSYLGIVNTLNGFLLCMDRNRGDQFADLFSNTGTCEIIKAGVKVSGRESLKGLCESLHSRFSPALHMESNVRIKMISDHEAENESYWMAMMGGDVVSTGFHEDLLVQCGQSGEWKFQRRVIRHHWTKDGGFEQSNNNNNNDNSNTVDTNK